MAESMQPWALTYNQMMNGGRQQVDDAEYAREQELQQQRVQDLERVVAQLEQALADQGSNSIPLDKAVS